MKPTAVFFAVISLLAGETLVGCSFNTKDKERTATNASELILAEKSLKEVKAAAAPLPGIKIAPVRKAVKPQLVDVYIKPSICEGLSADPDVIPPREEKDSSIAIDDSTVSFMCVLEIEAAYPGGIEAWRRFLNKNLKYITDTSGKGIFGEVMVDFVIDEEGNVTDVKANCGVEPLTTEAIRVIKKSKKWIPAKRSNRYVRSFKRQPFVFRGE
jgi:hypothetical protein